MLTDDTEYIWNYYFYQDGNVELEIRLTGILQVYAQDKDEPNVFGTTVAPGINAHYHQHLFSIRVDPMVDGLYNTVVETDVLTLPDAPTGSETNHAGNAFITRDIPIATQGQGARDVSYETDRRWTITNPKKVHPSSKKNVGYTVGVKGAAVKLMTQQDSVVATRATFAKKPLWIVKDVEGPLGGRMWPSGKYVPQTTSEPKDSLHYWIRGEEALAEEDLVVFVTMGK